MYDKYNWRFDKEIVNGFDKHVRQSVPLYEMFHKSIVDLSKYFIRRGTKIYDLGTSTGYFINSLYKEINRDNEFIGVDIESSMIEECKRRHKDTNIKFILENVLDVDFANSSVISMILLLQFLEKGERTKLLTKIYNEVEENTALFIVEKIKTSQIDLHDAYNDVYYDFKRSQELTDKEILDKNISLRGIMKPMLLEECIKILKDIGFKVDINVKYNNFVSIIAIK